MVYEMSEERHQQLLKACQPIPYLVFGGIEPASPAEHAEAVWRELGDELGFDWKTAQPIDGANPRMFSAEPSTELP